MPAKVGLANDVPLPSEPQTAGKQVAISVANDATSGTPTPAASNVLFGGAPGNDESLARYSETAASCQGAILRDEYSENPPPDPLQTSCPTPAVPLTNLVPPTAVIHGEAAGQTVRKVLAEVLQPVAGYPC